MGRRALSLDPYRNKVVIDSPEKVFEIFKAELSHLSIEKFFVVILNKQNLVTKIEELSKGTLDASLVTPREVFKVAIDNRAASIILVHNHPSGNLEPSKEDINVTQKLYEVGELVEIPVLDHIIIANNAFTSFLDRGIVFKRK